MNHCLLISKENEIIICKFYEVEEYCKKIIEKKIENNLELAKQFQEFSKKYSYFKPYFDFVIFELGYKIENPFDLEQTFLYEKNGKLILKQFGFENELEGKSDDFSIGLYYAEYNNLTTSLVDENRYGIAGSRHKFIALLIARNLFIKDEKLYLEYLEERETFPFIDFEYENFLHSHTSYLSVDKIVKDKKQYPFAIFKNSDIVYQVYGCVENVSIAQQELINEALKHNVIEESNIHLKETIRRNV